jgi:hypothetical protein
VFRRLAAIRLRNSSPAAPAPKLSRPRSRRPITAKLRNLLPGDPQIEVVNYLLRPSSRLPIISPQLLDEPGKGQTMAVYTVPSAEATSPDAGPFTRPALSPDRGVCHACLRGPAAPLMIVKQTGMVVTRRSTTFNAVLCQPCGTAIFRQAQAHNLAFGWWGIVSFITNFFTLAGNFSRSRKHRMIGSSAEMPLRVPLNPGRPVWQRPQMIVPVVLVAAFVAAGISSAGRANVPALHAGQCIDVPSNGAFRDVKLVPCAEPHDAEVAGVLASTDSPAATDTGEACAEVAAKHVLLSRADDVELSTFERTAASSESSHSSIRAICVLTGLNDAKLVGHVTG